MRASFTRICVMAALGLFPAAHPRRAASPPWESQHIDHVGSQQDAFWGASFPQDAAHFDFTALRFRRLRRNTELILLYTLQRTNPEIFFFIIIILDESRY